MFKDKLMQCVLYRAASMKENLYLLVLRVETSILSAGGLDAVRYDGLCCLFELSANDFATFNIIGTRLKKKKSAQQTVLKSRIHHI